MDITTIQSSEVCMFDVFHAVEFGRAAETANPKPKPATSGLAQPGCVLWRYVVL